MFAVTCHHGSSLHYGHYTSYVRGPEGQWYNADDDDVQHVHAKDVLHDRSAYLLSYVRIQPGETQTPAATPRADSASLGKRQREDETPSSNKRSPPPKANGTPKPKANGLPNGSTPALARLASQYDSSDDESPLPAPKPQRLNATNSPIPRPSNPKPILPNSPPRVKATQSPHSSPRSKTTQTPVSPPRSPGKKNKFHHSDPKRGLHGVHKKGAPMPFAVGRRGKDKNMRSNGMMDKLTKREATLGRRKGMIGRMQGRA